MNRVVLAVAIAVTCVGCGKSVDKSAGKSNEQREAEAWEKMQKGGDGKNDNLKRQERAAKRAEAERQKASEAYLKTEAEREASVPAK